MRIERIQAATFKLWPLEGKEKYEDAWKECKKAIDEGGRQIVFKEPLNRVNTLRGHSPVEGGVTEVSVAHAWLWTSC